MEQKRMKGWKRKKVFFLCVIACSFSVFCGCDRTEEVPALENPAVEDLVQSEPLTETSPEMLTTEALVTEDPTLEAPTTEPPATEASTTEASTTEASTTEVPTTEAPTTETPTTEAPTTEVPTTEAPTTEAPTVVSVQAKVKGTYYVGDTLSAADFVIMVTMSDGSQRKNPAGWGADPLYLSNGENAITVTYQGVTTQVMVYAQERPVETETPEEEKQQQENQEGTSSNSQPEQNEGTSSTGMSLRRDAAEEAFRIQNDLIVQNGGTPLIWSETYYQQACGRAQEIVTNFSHDGFYDTTAYAENIAMGSYDAGVMVRAWYNSDGHRNNMLYGWKYGAIACYGDYWVALFGPTEG